MAENHIDLAERLDIVEAIFHSIIKQENQELSDILSRFKTENVQWVLNMVTEPLEQLYDAIELEYESSLGY
jgi:nucleoid-associated protein YejK